MLFKVESGRVVLPPDVHHLPNLLDLTAAEILAAFRTSQIRDFDEVLTSLEVPGSPLQTLFAEVRGLAPDDSPLGRLGLFQPGALRTMFLDLHDHVMGHPVWMHPFFVRFFGGGVSEAQLVAFAKNYFNQIKNTRQCVAMAIGRFHGLMGLPYGQASERISELTQIALAQLVADEYGVGVHAIDDYPPLDRLFQAKTHIVMYRQLFDGLGIPFAEQDVPLLPGVADNVLIQRLVAGHPAFTPLESLASVGLGMEWGVPEFFSMLLGGVLKYAVRTGAPLNERHLEVLTAHVKYDVLHAVSVMVVTALYITGDDDLRVVKEAVNSLMAGRYGMMTSLYRHVFNENCPSLHEADLAPRYRLTDPRFADELRRARRTIPATSVVGGEEWHGDQAVPFVMG